MKERETERKGMRGTGRPDRKEGNVRTKARAKGRKEGMKEMTRNARE